MMLPPVARPAISVAIGPAFASPGLASLTVLVSPSLSVALLARCSCRDLCNFAHYDNGKVEESE